MAASHAPGKIEFVSPTRRLTGAGAVTMPRAGRRVWAKEDCMPPHCDSLDGPVVKAAQQALASRDVKLVLPYVPAAGEAEVIEAFNKVLPLRTNGAPMREVADRYFYETVVRVHR